MRCLFATCTCLLLAGCANNPYVLEGKLQDLRRNQQDLTARSDDTRRRADLLDGDNQRLETLLAQARQQNQLLEDQVTALRDQLKSNAEQIARNRDGRMTSSASGSPRATISANNSLRGNLPQFDLPGVEVRYDGDVIRVELPGGRLFEQGDATIRPQSVRMVEEVGAELARRYPDQLIGIEGHTDSDPVRQSHRWLNNHQLSVSRASAVFDLLTSRTRLRGEQLFIVGHGSNHPVVSNATAAGKERNRRVELVVYPEQVSR